MGAPISEPGNNEPVPTMQRTAWEIYETFMEKHRKHNKKQRKMKNIPEIVCIICILVAAVSLAFESTFVYCLTFTVMWILFVRNSLFVTKK